jgi:hypothetical protein
MTSVADRWSAATIRPGSIAKASRISATTAQTIRWMRGEDPFEATREQALRRLREAALRCPAGDSEFVPFPYRYYAAGARRHARAQRADEIGVS